MAKIKTERLRVGDMTCVNCQTRIENALRKTDGIKRAKVSYSGGRADVIYDADIVKLSGVRAVIERAGYTVLTQRAVPKSRLIEFGLLVIIAALYFLWRVNPAISLPLAETGMGYGMLLLIGLLTSVHCVAMCGGINLSQCIPKSDGNPLRASALYNAGRVAGYTVVGFIVGGIGGVITPSGALRGAVQLIAGVLMVIMGLNMLGIFPFLRRFQLRLPSLRLKSSSPLIVGLLNSLMPCGPLQAMQLYALSTGSPVKGAASMLLFSLGTVPLMFGLGALSSLLTKKFTQKAMTVGAVLVTVLGLIMFTQGAALSGFSLGGASAKGEITVVDGVQLVNSELKSGSYPNITVQAGIPVKWTIDAPQGSINGCNRTMNIPEYGIEYTFTQGENIILFTPEKTGKFTYSCWMGMIRSSITVVEGS
ncbi:hypothetical protein FACS18949_13840 [Clostridia bacterium]|nr:hypothetical protein FACS189425_02530 [Clostridia bacterium]GHV35584.1 hypothetical protein FACS18949_13840 [Clostridia bacterium]